MKDIITKQQKRYLRSLGHKIKPVVSLGKAGFNENVFEEIVASLKHHELIKVKINCENRKERKTISDEIISKSGAALIQSIGNMILIYKANKDDRRIDLP